MNAAIQKALDRAFGGYRYTAVAAIHTRNQAGEIHYHAHVLVGKFAKKLETGRTYSLGTRAGGNTGRRRLLELKPGWQEGIEKEFRERLSLGVEQKTPRSSVSLVMPNGTRLEPFNRDSRRMLEKELSPTFTETTKDGHAVVRRFRWSAMDDRIFEIASGTRGTSAWDATAFKEVFPDQRRYLTRYEARVLTLKSIGYLSADGAITVPFQVHFAAHHGVLTPELQRVRIDLLHRLAKDKDTSASAVHPTQFWAQVQRYADLRRRVERLGYSKDEVASIFERAKSKKPTRENLQKIRSAAQRKASLTAPAPGLPKTKTILRAYVDLQKSKLQRIYLISSGVIQFWKLGGKLARARYVKKVAERDLFFAKEKRIAQVGRALRPVIWLVRVAMPREARRLDQAITRCARLANQQQIWRAGHAATQNAYEQWHKNHIEQPIAQLKNASRALERPVQQAELGRLDQAQSRIRLPDEQAAAELFRRGYQALVTRPDCEPKTLARVSTWVGKEDELVSHVFDQSKGKPSPLTQDEYAAAIKIGRVGNLLAVAERSAPLKLPVALEPQRSDIERLVARLGAFGHGRSLTPTNLTALSPAQLREQLVAAGTFSPKCLLGSMCSRCPMHCASKWPTPPTPRPSCLAHSSAPSTRTSAAAHGSASCVAGCRQEA
jgi:hypothetical protein